jgi:3-deoxy-D-manno-octulosonic-acid transferase
MSESSRFMIWLYRTLFLPALLVLAPHYLLRMMRRGGYKKGFASRFGLIPPLPPRQENVRRYWIQAVSVGEIFAVTPIIRRLREESDCEIFLTTTTSTGFALAHERLADLTIGIAYFPLDFWPCSALTWRKVKADVCVLFEAEIWPEHLFQAQKRRVPVILINARMSDRTFGRLSRIPFFAANMFNRFGRILAASQEDRERFLALGADQERVVTSGNVKLDVTLDPVLSEKERDLLAERLGLTEPQREKPLIILGSSTWPGEERALLRFLQRARSEGIDCRLLIVPRHAERRGEIAALLEEFPFSHHFRSAGQAPGPVDVAVGDTTGELVRFTQLADLIFVGKSLPPNNGGQTPIEAAALGKPLVYGPYMTNFRLIARQLVDSGGALVVGDETDFIENSLPLLRNARRRNQMAEAAKSWHASNRGAVDKTIGELLAVRRS